MSTPSTPWSEQKRQDFMAQATMMRKQTRNLAQELFPVPWEEVRAIMDAPAKTPAELKARLALYLKVFGQHWYGGE